MQSPIGNDVQTKKANTSSTTFNKLNSALIGIFSHITHPDPLPPTMATFFPAGTSKDTPARTFCPFRYSKYTLSKAMDAVWGVIFRGGASFLSYEKKNFTLSAAQKLSPTL